MLSFFSLESEGQSVISIRQYYQAPHRINPAFSGIEDYWSFHAGYQKVQFPNAITNESMLLAMNLTFPYQRGKTPYMNSNTLMSSKPDLQAKLQQLVANRIVSVRSGVGLSIQQQRIEKNGFLRTEGQFSYAVHIPINRKTSISGGLMASYLDDRLDLGKYYIRNEKDPTYQNLVNNGGKSNLGSLQAGVSLQGLLYYLGYSFGSGIKSWNFRDSEELQYKHILSAGFKWPINSYMIWYNSSFVEISSNKSTYNFFSRFDIIKKFKLGAGYTSNEHMSGFASLYFHPIQLDYSYSVPLASDLGVVANVRMHEFTLSYFLFRSDFESRYFW